VRVIDPATGDAMYATTLCEHIDAATDDPGNERVLQLLIEFLEVGVTVSVPNWNVEIVDPGFWD
jgi:hypothetical protein